VRVQLVGEDVGALLRLGLEAEDVVNADQRDVTAGLRLTGDVDLWV